MSSALGILQRLERAAEPAGPLGWNHHAWTGLRETSAKDYADAVQQFVQWAGPRGLPLHYPAEIDRAVVAYASDHRLARAKLETLIAALKRALPSVRRNMVWAEDTAKRLKMLSPPVHKVPMMRHVAIALGHRLAITGMSRAGALLILQFCTGLRPGEVLALQREDLVAPRAHLNNGNAVIALGRKRGTKAGRPQFVIVRAAEDPVAIAIVSAFARTTKPGCRLTSLDYNGYYKLLTSGLRDLGLSQIKYTPHSPRAGWATAHRLSGLSFQEIQERGRWSCASSLRIYLDAVAASTVLLQQTTYLLEFAAYVESDFVARYPWWRR